MVLFTTKKSWHELIQQNKHKRQQKLLYRFTVISQVMPVHFNTSHAIITQ